MGVGEASFGRSPEGGGARALLVVGLLTVVGLGPWGVGTARAQGTSVGASPLESLEESLVGLIESAERSVVSVARTRRTRAGLPGGVGFGDRRIDGFERFDDRESLEDSRHIPNDFGTGVVIQVAETALILTNYHLVRGGPIAGDEQTSESVLSVRLPNRRFEYAKIIAADPRSDLAVISIPLPKPMPVPPSIAAIKLYTGVPLKKGQLVVGLGNPYAIGRDGSASAALGMISNIARQPAQLPDHRLDPDSLRRETIHHLGTLLHVDLRLDLGTSGGALVNTRGELVGITTPLVAIDGYERSAGFAVPVDGTTERIIRALESGLEVEYGFLGVSLGGVLTEETAEIVRRLRRPGAAVVEAVQSNTPAERAGLRDRDVVVAIGNSAVLSDRDLMRQIGLIAPGEVAELVVVRPGDNVDGDEPRPQSIKVEVGKWPAKDDEGIVATKRRYAPWRGLVVDFPTARHRFMPQEPRFQGLAVNVPQAVLVTERLAKSAAERAEIQPGDFITHVNDEPVQTPEAFYRICRALPEGPVKLTRLGSEKPVVVE
jgi:serine protease Do